MAVAISADLAFQRATHDATPGIFLLPAVIAVAVSAGTTAGLVASAAAVAFGAVDLSEAGPLLAAPFDRLIRLAVLCVTAPTAALVVGLLRDRVLATSAERTQTGVQAERHRAEVDRQAYVIERNALLTQRDSLADSDRQTQRRLADLIAAVPGVVWESVVDGRRLRVAFISHYIQSLLGEAPARWVGSDDLWSSAVHPDDRDRVAAWLHAACSATNLLNAEPVEFRWLAVGGATVWVETRLAAVPALARGPGCVALRGVTSDITARKHLEAAVQQRAAELATIARQLQESNAELDQFAYVSSHDLKAPLRGIANLSNWIEEDLGPDRVTHEAHAQFELLRGRVSRMERLIDGLLQYSQVGRVGSTVEWVDVGRLLSEVVDWVGPPPTVRVAVGSDMPTFNADRLRLSQVLANLIGNAVKHGEAGGRVRVTRETPPAGFDGFQFAVSDDGPGIDAKYHERIFGVFQTLQPRDKVEGTGIGLALVRKVVVGKGGTIVVDSAVGRGATFRFTWPRLDPTAVIAAPSVARGSQEVVS